MRSKYKLGVIIPLYNADSYSRNYMGSLIAQTWKDLEIIIVSDGSTNCSVNTIRYYVEEYPHVRLLHQTSQGVSIAQNLGPDAAVRGHIVFVDTDDEVYPEMYETLTGMALHNNPDVIQDDASWSPRETSRVWVSIPTDRLHSTGALSGPDWSHMGLTLRRWTHVLWMGVCRSDLIKGYDIRFIPELHYQDVMWNMVFMLNATRMKYMEKPLYRYYQHGGSISRMKRQGETDLSYQRHYIGITRLLNEPSHSYANRITAHLKSRQQMIYEGLRVCHCIHKEPDPQIRQHMIAKVFVSGMFKRMVSNVCSVKLGYQVLL